NPFNCNTSKTTVVKTPKDNNIFNFFQFIFSDDLIDSKQTQAQIIADKNRSNTIIFFIIFTLLFLRLTEILGRIDNFGCTINGVGEEIHLYLFSVQKNRKQVNFPVKLKSTKTKFRREITCLTLMILNYYLIYKTKILY